jgi:hypothetical protein
MHVERMQPPDEDLSFRFTKLNWSGLENEERIGAALRMRLPRCIAAGELGTSGQITTSFIHQVIVHVVPSLHTQGEHSRAAEMSKKVFPSG